jgi:hypothetical integral membrane protein (TIGR02206 family)
MHQFSIAHLAALAALLIGAILAVLLPRRYPGGWIRWARVLLAAVILAGWAGEYVADVVDGIWTLRYSLPLQLTDAVSLGAILALLTERQLLIELVYFWAFSASLQAVLTPDLGSTFPSAFYFTYFAYHVGSILTACLLVFGCRRYPRPYALWRAYALTLGWTAIAGLGDLITGGNYMYLAHKPLHASLLNAMGPWPAYIASGAILALAMFAVLAAIARAVQQREPGAATNDVGSVRRPSHSLRRDRI